VSEADLVVGAPESQKEVRRGCSAPPRRVPLIDAFLAFAAGVDNHVAVTDNGNDRLAEVSSLVWVLNSTNPISSYASLAGRRTSWLADPLHYLQAACLDERPKS